MDIFNDKENKKIENSSGELDDIILDKNSKKFDIKKIALLGGVAILLLIIVISIVKMTSPSTNQEIITQTSKNQQIQSSKESFDQEIPITEEEKSDFNVKPKEITPKEEQTHPTIQEIEKKIQPKVTIPQTKKEITHQNKQLTEKPKKTHKKRVKKTYSKKTTVSKGDYYIQVAAFFRFPPSKKFLNKIKRDGFSYVIKTVIRDKRSIKKVLIGPFKSKKEAKKSLTTIRKNINKNAYILRIK